MLCARDTYAAACAEQGVRPNEVFLTQLSPSLDSMRNITVIDMRNTFLGAKACHTIAPIVAICRFLTHLLLPRVGLTPSSSKEIITTLRSHAAISHVDFSFNDLNTEVGISILELICMNRRIESFKLEHTLVIPALKKKIDNQLDRNGKLTKIVGDTLGEYPKKAESALAAATQTSSADTIPLWCALSLAAICTRLLVDGPSFVSSLFPTTGAHKTYLHDFYQSLVRIGAPLKSEKDAALIAASFLSLSPCDEGCSSAFYVNPFRIIGILRPHGCEGLSHKHQIVSDALTDVMPSMSIATTEVFDLKVGLIAAISSYCSMQHPFTDANVIASIEPLVDDLLSPGNSGKSEISELQSFLAPSAAAIERFKETRCDPNYWLSCTISDLRRLATWSD